MSKKLSVITVCRNAAKSIEKCVRSVIEQSYRPIEYILIDGASTDQTPAIIQKYYDHIAVLVSEPDNGIYSAMNKGLLHATGDLVYFINADDYLVDKHVLADVAGFIETHPDADVYYGSIEIRDENGAKVVVVPDADKAAEFLVCGCLPHQATFARRAVFERTGLFDERYRRHADYDWFLKVVADPELKLVRFDRIVAFFNSGGASSQLALGQPEVYRIQNASPLYQSEEWSRRRIEILQGALLATRIENAELTRQLRRAIHKPGDAFPPVPSREGPSLSNSLKCWFMGFISSRAFGPLRVFRRYFSTEL
jgi:glycosyltransferase involved in cell wall biosynthesis